MGDCFSKHNQHGRHTVSLPTKPTQALLKHQQSQAQGTTNPQQCTPKHTDENKLLNQQKIDSSPRKGRKNKQTQPCIPQQQQFQICNQADLIRSEGIDCQSMIVHRPKAKRKGKESQKHCNNKKGDDNPQISNQVEKKEQKVVQKSRFAKLKSTKLQDYDFQFGLPKARAECNVVPYIDYSLYIV